jgi:hypothetical protein
MSVMQEPARKNITHPPTWLPDNVHANRTAGRDQAGSAPAGHSHTRASGRSGDPVAPFNFIGIPTNANTYWRSRDSSSRLRFSMM